MRYRWYCENAFGLGGHFWKNQYWFSAVSLIFIEPGTSRRVDFSPPRSDISQYAQVFFPLRINDFNCFLLRNPMNFNCFFRHFNCVNTQIRSLIRVLPLFSENASKILLFSLNVSYCRMSSLKVNNDVIWRFMTSQCATSRKWVLHVNGSLTRICFSHCSCYYYVIRRNHDTFSIECIIFLCFLLDKFI